jgi:hypothetical protein
MKKDFWLIFLAWAIALFCLPGMVLAWMLLAWVLSHGSPPALGQ